MAQPSLRYWQERALRAERERAEVVKALDIALEGCAMLAAQRMDAERDRDEVLERLGVDG